MARRLPVLLLGLALVVTGCGDDDDDPGSTTSIDTTATTVRSTTTIAATTIAAPTTTAPTATAPSTTAATAPTTAAPAPAFAPGDPCPLGSDYDCIDPDGDGQGTYLIGGGDCMSSPIAGGLCSDLDGDGHAGYPDSG